MPTENVTRRRCSPLPGLDLLLVASPVMLIGKDFVRKIVFEIYENDRDL
jgi:hypothetical protein